MKMQKKPDALIEFAKRTLLNYSRSTLNPPRSTSDLSPLEEWLIARLYEATKVLVEKQRAELRVDRELLLDYLRELRSFWQWKEGYPRYEKELKELDETIKKVKIGRL